MNVATHNEDAKIAEFNAYAGQTREVAMYWLRRCDWDVEAAKHWFWVEVICVCDSD